MHSSFPRKVKIVGTLGPASKTVEQIEKLIRAGLDIARLNFSHGDHEFHRGLIANVREASKRAGRPVAIMQDLQGPKIRAGKLPGGSIELKTGDKVVLFPEGETPKKGGKGRLEVPISAEIAMAVTTPAKVGNRVLFDDGKIATRILEIAAPEMVVEVEVGGVLTNNKGMNLPGTPLTIPCLTEKDIVDLEFGLSMGVDAVALSFVRTADDIEDLRARMKKKTDNPPLIVAKIEREEAVTYMDSIIEVTDGLLVARGDMAVEIGAERVPTVQKRLIHACNQLGVPVITATQMLESMVGSPTPTRAEASDVANAVFDGTDAVMLSAESASGQYPVVAVETMARIILESERSKELYSAGGHVVMPMAGSVVESIEFSASRIATHTGSVAIAVITHSGVAAKSLAKYRPEIPIIAFTENDEVVRRLLFTWGIRSMKIPQIVPTDDIFAVVERVLAEHKLAEPEDLIVITAGIPTLRRGTTNMIKVHRVGASSQSPRPGRSI
ncbi:MAG: pyruvate kinase [Bdellovibrionales bacterium]|nr:pyruvate kinase [Bdellovibrionales bacterium]